jgi:hypothetical protein
MTAIRALDQNGDWEFGRGLSSYKRKQDAIIQNLKTKLKEWKFDCFFAQNSGVDYNNRLSKTNQKSLLDQEIKRIIVSTEGVINLNSFESSVEVRDYRADFNVTTVYSSNVGVSFQI